MIMTLTGLVIPFNQSTVFDDNCADSVGLYDCIYKNKKKEDEIAGKEINPENKLTYEELQNRLNDNYITDDTKINDIKLINKHSFDSFTKNQNNGLASKLDLIGNNADNDMRLRLEALNAAGRLYEKLSEYEKAIGVYSTLDYLYDFDLSYTSLKWSKVFNEI